MSHDHAHQTLVDETSDVERQMHKLRNLMHCISGFSQLLHQQAAGQLTEEQMSYLDHILGNAAKASDILESIRPSLCLSRGE